MKFQSLFKKLLLLTLTLTAAGAVFAQKPRQENLLNGLKVLLWSNPASDKVTVKIRVHSGSAFDPQEKEGVAKLLSDAIFPNSASREFFADDLGGSLDITSNYDFIQITATAKSSEFLSMLETLAAAVSDPVINKETLTALKTEHLAKLAEIERDPVYLADRAAAKRLFGTFPYGRPEMGTPTSIQKIDFVDLRFAKDRFFSADNATIAISGNFDSNLAFRAVRRYFGDWLKADKKIPSTFKQPDEPDTAPSELPAGADITRAHVRYAMRGLARNDKDHAAAEILSRVLDARFKAQRGPEASVTHNAHILPGSIVFRTIGEGRTDRKVVAASFSAITNEEFQKAKAEMITANAKSAADEIWLDADTYKFAVPDATQAFQNATLADVQRVADRLSKNPMVSVTAQPPTTDDINKVN